MAFSSTLVSSVAIGFIMVWISMWHALHSIGLISYNQFGFLNGSNVMKMLILQLLGGILILYVSYLDDQLKLQNMQLFLLNTIAYIINTLLGISIYIQKIQPSFGKDIAIYFSGLENIPPHQLTSSQKHEIQTHSFKWAYTIIFLLNGILILWKSPDAFVS